MEAPIRVCLIEDDDDDYVATRDLLRESRDTRCQLDRLSTYAEAVEALQRGEHDVYLIDYRLGARNGLELLRQFAASSAPMIILTGQDDRDVDLEAMRSGAMDYLVKGQTDAAVLERSIRYSIARRRTEESLRRKDEFLAMLGHELRNPLAPIRTALHIMDMPQVDRDAVQRAKDVLHRQVNHLVRLVDDLLDVSRIVLRRIELRKQPTDLMEIIRHAVDTADPVIEAHGQKLEMHVPPESVLVIADAIRLAQAITNLLVNAANHSESPGLIRLTVEQHRGEVLIRVRDWGVGIPKDLLPQVFDLFVQGRRSLARSEGGLGIGLTLVKGIVELHGGTVQASSDGPGTGSEFVIRMPAKGDHEELRRPRITEDTTIREQRRRVLIVDDNVDAAEMMAMMLQMDGHHVELAHDGFAAVEVAQRSRPDVILLDIGLPRRDGYEVARLLRMDPALAQTKIIAVTGYGQPEDKRRSKEAGIDDHLTKPVDPEALTNAVARREDSISPHD
jgi:signal transduction histidine kinase